MTEQIIESKRVCSDADSGVSFDDVTVQIIGREVYKRQRVARYRCSACGRCALVATAILDDELPEGTNRSEAFTEALNRSGFCDAAKFVAPYNEGDPSLSTATSSVVQ